MYLRYELTPHFLNQKFTIDHPVATVQDADSYRQHLLQSQGKGKDYGGFKIVDMAKKNVLKLYEELKKKPRVLSTDLKNKHHNTKRFH